MAVVYTIDNIRKQSIKDNPVKFSKIIDGDKWNTHRLENEFTVLLSNGRKIFFPEGFTWDLASVPQIFHGLIRPEGDDNIAYLIHDYLYKTRIESRKFSDDEMLKWSKAMKQTSKISLRNIDIHIRHIAVRLFGWVVWNRNKKKT